MFAEMSNFGFLGLMAFVIAAGFTWSGLLSSIHMSFFSTHPEFRLSYSNPATAAWSFILCMFAGPFIIVSNTSKYWRKGFLPLTILFFGFALALMWSFCSGVVLVQLAAYFGVISA